MKLLMMFISLMLAGFGAYVMIARHDAGGIFLLAIGIVCFLFFASVKKWQYRASDELYEHYNDLP